MSLFLNSLFGSSATTQVSPAVQTGNAYAKAMQAKDVRTLTGLFTQKAQIENNIVESLLLEEECFRGGKAWADATAKFTIANTMVGSAQDSSEACVVMIMDDPANPSRRIWSMHLIKVELIESKYQITGMRVVEAPSYDN